MFGPVSNALERISLTLTLTWAVNTDYCFHGCGGHCNDFKNILPYQKMKKKKKERQKEKEKEKKEAEEEEEEKEKK